MPPEHVLGCPRSPGLGMNLKGWAGMFDLSQTVLSEAQAAIADQRAPNPDIWACIWMRRLQGLEVGSETVLGCLVCSKSADLCMECLESKDLEIQRRVGVP